MVLSNKPTIETQFSLKMKRYIGICSILITLDRPCFVDMLGFLNLSSEMMPRTEFHHLIETFELRKKKIPNTSACLLMATWFFISNLIWWSDE